jgi:D-alanyl-D-alanine carboxypeptidase
MKILSILSFVFLSCYVHAQITDSQAAAMQLVLDNKVTQGNDHGISAYVISSDGTVWQGVAGEDGAGDSITDSTVFHGASTTKCHVATLCMLLAEDGLLDLEATWPSYVDLDVAFNEAITVRQLLSHTSGIADYLETGSAEGYIFADDSFQFTGQYILEEIVSSTPLFAPGAGFQYSNSNYALLGLIIESITENSVAQELRSRIWEPLGLEHTYFGGFEVHTETHAGVWWNFGSGLNDYSAYNTQSMLSFAYCAGNIVTTPKDEAIFLEALMNGEIVNETSLTEMFDFVPASFGSWTAGYGLGLHHAVDTGSDVVLGHDGYYTNLTSMFHSADCDFTIVTMTNTFTTWYGIFAPLYAILSDNCIVDIEEPTPDQPLNIAPNPTKGKIQISNLGGSATKTPYAVYDFKGALLDKGVFTGAFAQMDLSAYGSGVYLVQVGDRSERVVVE